jgi:predicted NAD/FAD-binding protein
MAWCGTYHFNASDTDFDSHLTIRFYPNRGEAPTEWFADGTISDSLRLQKLAFKRGFVTMTDAGPEIHCINLGITPYQDKEGQKSFWIDHREHYKDDAFQSTAQKAQR